MKFDRCPRCSGEWRLDIRRFVCSVDKCGMIYWPSNPQELHLLSLSLWWNVDKHTCDLTRDRTVMPYLPYTITREDLDKYLVLL